MTTIKSLKDMYLKLGGSLTDTYEDIAGGKAVGTYATIPEMIQACTKKAGSGGGGSDLPEHTAADNGKFLGVVEGDLAWAENSGLPDYTAADNGKFLGVVDGEAAWAEAGEEPFYVTFTVTNPETFEIGSADKTFAEIAAADAAGKRIVGKFVVTVEEQEMEVLEADVNCRRVGEHGNAYVWQIVDTERISTFAYDVEGITSSVSPWGDIVSTRYVVEFTQSGTDWTSSRSISQIYEAWTRGKDVVGISGGIVLQLIGISSTEAAFNVTVTAGTKLAYSQFRQYIDGNDQEVVEVIEKSIVVE